MKAEDLLKALVDIRDYKDYGVRIPFYPECPHDIAKRMRNIAKTAIAAYDAAASSTPDKPSSTL